VGISGASGVVYGIRLLEALDELGVESHLVISKAGQLTIGWETALTPKAVAAKADFSYAAGDVAAPIASGSFRTKGMIVAPCSVRSMSEIATGVTTTLLTRAADVVLKERRTLVLLVRETPLHLGHLRTMAALAEMGAVILPPSPPSIRHPRLWRTSSIRLLHARSTVSGMIGPRPSVGARARQEHFPAKWSVATACGPVRRRKCDQRRVPVPRRREMTGEVTAPDEVALRAKLTELVQEHRDLDAAIEALSLAHDQLQLTRLKKRKLQLKDQIQKINDQLLPDIIA